MKTLMVGILSALSFLWPFHKKKLGPPAVVVELPFYEKYCTQSGDTWWFVGPDGAYTVSDVSCRDAAEQWLQPYNQTPVGQI